MASISDTIKAELTGLGYSGTIADGEYTRLKIKTGLTRGSIADLYAAAGEINRISGEISSAVALKTLWSDTPSSITEYAMGNTAITGIVFKATTPLTISRLRLFKAAAITGTCKFGIYGAGQILVANNSVTASAGQGWLECSLPFTPVVGTYYLAVVFVPSVTNNYVSISPSVGTQQSSSDGAIVTLLPTDSFEGSSAAGRYLQGAGDISFPTIATPTNYGVDIMYT